MEQKYILFKSIPRVTFANAYSAKQKSYFLPVVENCLEVAYIFEGKYYVEAENKVQEFSKGDIICNTFDIRKKVTIKEYFEIRTFIIYFDADNFNTPVPGSYGFAPFIENGTQEAKELAALIEKICAQYAINGEKSLKLMSYVFSVLSILNGCHKSGIHTADEESFSNISYANKIKKYIADKISYKISLDSIAQHIGLSVPYMCNVFKKVTGETIIEYINKAKLSKIRNLVIFGNMTLKQASEEAGLYDISYVSRMFKKYYNASITELKKTLYYD